MALSSQVSALCFAHRHFFEIDAALSPCILRRQYSEGVNMCPYHGPRHFKGYEHKYKYKFDESKKTVDEKRSNHTDSSGRK